PTFAGIPAQTLFHRFQIFFRARRALRKKVEQRGSAATHLLISLPTTHRLLFTAHRPLPYNSPATNSPNRPKNSERAVFPTSDLRLPLPKPCTPTSPPTNSASSSTGPFNGATRTCSAT